MIRTIFFYAVFLFFNSAYAEDDSLVLPEPLSFQAALDFADKQYHYSFNQSQSTIALVRAGYLESTSQNDIEVSLKGYVRNVGVSDLGDNSKDFDRKISVIAKKNLYDFGLTSDKEKWLESLIIVNEASSLVKKEQYLNQVLKAYFDVLKADNTFLFNNENMSIAFVQFDKAKQKLEFGLTSDLDILKAQSHYEKVRQQRYLSESQQRFTRQVLSELLGASTLPDQLETPNIKLHRKIIGDVNQIIDLALLNSESIKLQQAKLNSAMLGIALASSSNTASIDAVLEVSDYEYSSPTRDKWRAGINFNFPLYSGDRVNSAVQSAKAKYQLAAADMQQASSLLRLKILSLWQVIEQKTVELEGAKIQQEYRDLYLEQSRANYELDYQSDLGDSMVQFSHSRAERLSTGFDLELAWYELILLVGNHNSDKLLKIAENN